MTDPNHADIARDLYTLKGEMHSEMKSVRDRVEKLERAVEKGFESINDALSVLNAAESERRGGGKVLMFLSGILGGAATIVGEWLLAHFGGK